MDNEAQKDQTSNTEKKPPSLLEEILAKSGQSPTPAAETEGTKLEENIVQKEVTTIKKPKEPITFATFAKLIGTLFFVAIIFLGSFLAYIAFNPDQAVFFAKIFNIHLEDIKWWLSNLINGSFWTIIFFISIAWMVSLFRAFWTPKEFKRKRLLSWLIAIVIGILLFSILAFWAFLFSIINAKDYTNPDGAILIYDQELYNQEDSRWSSRIIDTTNMIGPITVAFDLRSNAIWIIKNQLFAIESYSINFDWARCSNGNSVMQGSDPTREQSIICTFDQVKAYNIKGTYTGKNNLWINETIDIKIPNIEIRWLVSSKEQKDVQNNNIITLDASSLKSIGTPRWVYQESGKEVTETSITETLSSNPKYICLKVYGNGCDRIFVLQNSNIKNLEWTIISEQDTVNPLQFYFAFTWVNIPVNQITNIEWLLNDNTIICKKGENTCTYTFVRYGINKVKLIFEIATGERKEIEKEVNVREPLTLERHVQVIDNDGNVLNKDPSTYQQDLRSYVLSENIAPPETLTLDARDVISKNPGYILESVRWNINAEWKHTEMNGKKVNITLNEPLRYSIEWIYTFKSQTNIPWGWYETARDNIIIDIERKNLIPRLSVTNSSDYVPSIVTVDASRSESTVWEIKKFIFDFGEGKAPKEWDSIQEYQYSTSWEKNITLTIIGNDGERASMKYTLVLKDQAETIDFTPSINPWVIDSTIDFEAKWTIWQIDDYIWNFWDNTPLVHWYSTSHIFQRKWTYDVTLTIVYVDGTRKNKTVKYEIVDSY